MRLYDRTVELHKIWNKVVAATVSGDCLREPLIFAPIDMRQGSQDLRLVRVGAEVCVIVTFVTFQQGAVCRFVSVELADFALSAVLGIGEPGRPHPDQF